MNAAYENKLKGEEAHYKGKTMLLILPNGSKGKVVALDDANKRVRVSLPLGVKQWYDFNEIKKWEFI